MGLKGSKFEGWGFRILGLGVRQKVPAVILASKELGMGVKDLKLIVKTTNPCGHTCFRRTWLVCELSRRPTLEM